MYTEDRYSTCSEFKSIRRTGTCSLVDCIYEELVLDLY